MKSARKRIFRLITSKQKSFTLIELLIVIAILGVLAAAVMVAVNPTKRTGQARDTQRKSDLSQIVSALEAYYAFKANYPNPYSPNPVDIDSSTECWIKNLELCAGNPFALYELIKNQDIKRLPYDPGKNILPGTGGCGVAQAYLYHASANADYFILYGVLEEKGNQECKPECEITLGAETFGFHFCYDSRQNKFIGI